MNIKNDFKWGTASSGPQTEGTKDKVNDSIWDHWYKIEPERFHENIGPEVTSNVFEEYQQDVNTMNEIGLNSFRTSIQWTRLISNYETGEVDKNAVVFYFDYFKQLKDSGIQVIVNLFHYDMPIELQQEYGGFESRKVCELYTLYAKKCFELFSDVVDMWTTFNEPMAYAKEAYHDNRIYPCEFNFDKMMQVNYNTVIAHAMTVKLFDEMKVKGEIGIILDCLPPLGRSNCESDKKACELADLLTNRIYLDPCILGSYPKDYWKFIEEYKIQVKTEPGDINLIKENTVDFVGINYYRPMRVRAPRYQPLENAELELGHLFEAYELPSARMNKYRGWEIYPKSMYDIAMRMKNNYGNIKWFISENGMGVEDEERFRENGMINDQYRIDFIREHLLYLFKAIEEGSNCFGYHIWTFIDNWSWINAYKNRYGYVEYNTQTGERRRKKSSYWIEEVIKTKNLNVEVQDECNE